MRSIDPQSEENEEASRQIKREVFALQMIARRTEHEILSECCGALQLGEIIDGWGICRDCREPASFTPIEE